MRKETRMSDQWETFCDECYYHMWRLRRKTERGWNDGFHINTKAEAEGLCELLNKLEGGLTQATTNLHEVSCKLLVAEKKRDESREFAKYVIKQRDRLAEALWEIADCDFVITLPDRMDAVRAIAREALGDIKWHKL